MAQINKNNFLYKSKLNKQIRCTKKFHVNISLIKLHANCVFSLKKYIFFYFHFPPINQPQTATKTTQVDTQLYPVFTSSSLDARQLHTITSDKLTHVLQDIDKAQDELQHRIHTTLGIQTKNPESLQKIEQVISNLRALKSKLEGIRYDYKTLLENILKFLVEITELQRNIDDFFAKQQQQQSQLGSSGEVADIERTIVEHEKFRDNCMDKFRSLITQSELLIDRVRALEPPGAREIDTDRILKLLENLRLHFEAGNSERMSRLERLGKLEQFKTDLCDINRSLDSVSKQLHEINGQSVDSLAAAKTTSLAFEYFERTIEVSIRVGVIRGWHVSCKAGGVVYNE